jgi:hypothetical protein
VSSNPVVELREPGQQTSSRQNAPPGRRGQSKWSQVRRSAARPCLPAGQAPLNWHPTGLVVSVSQNQDISSSRAASSGLNPLSQPAVPFHLHPCTTVAGAHNQEYTGKKDGWMWKAGTSYRLKQLLEICASFLHLSVCGHWERPYELLRSACW